MPKGVSGTLTVPWEGWGPVIETRYQSLLKYGLKLTKGNHDDALDIVQEAVRRVLDSGKTPRAAQAAFSYLRRAVWNVFLDSRKNSQRLVSYDDEQNTSLHNQLVDEWTSKIMQHRLEDEECRQRLQFAPGPLDEREQKLFEMHTIDGMKAKEIASELNEDPRVISYEINRIVAKTRYRAQRRKGK